MYRVIFRESSDEEEEEPEKVVVAENAVAESSSDPELENVPLMASENQAASSTMQQVLYCFRKDVDIGGLWNFMKIAQIVALPHVIMGLIHPLGLVGCGLINVLLFLSKVNFVGLYGI
jgi:hypothetical protein